MTTEERTEIDRRIQTVESKLDALTQSVYGGLNVGQRGGLLGAHMELVEQFKVHKEQNRGHHERTEEKLDAIRKTNQWLLTTMVGTLISLVTGLIFIIVRSSAG